MAQDMFLKLSGIEGESQDAAHKNEIEVLNWNWGATQLSNMHLGSGGGAGKATVHDLTFEHYVDRASPNLMKHCFTGKHLAEAALTLRKAGDSPLEYMKIKMFDVIISDVSVSGSDESSIGCERVSLSFSKVTYEYVVQNAQGGSAGTVAAILNIKENVAV